MNNSNENGEINDLSVSSLCQYLGLNRFFARDISSVLRKLDSEEKNGKKYVGRYVLETLTTCLVLNILTDNGILTSDPDWFKLGIRDYHKTPYKIDRDKLYELIKEAGKEKSAELKNQTEGIFNF